MHFHCEIVIPPTADIEGCVTAILKQFDENEADADHDRSHAFWDFWVIGGRWAGAKLMAQYDPSKIEEFREWLIAEKVTVSGVQFGKQELSPADQIPKVDRKWNEMFPSDRFIPCPMFRHSNDQHGNGLRGALPGDVLPLREVPKDLKCSRVIFAKPSYDDRTKDWTGPLEAEFMLCESQWNGCNYMKVDWDESFAAALNQYREKLKGYREEYAARMMPTDEWLAVTVDYHS